MTNIQYITDSIKTSVSLLTYELANNNIDYDMLDIHYRSLTNKKTLLDKLMNDEELTFIETTLLESIIFVATDMAEEVSA